MPDDKVSRDELAAAYFDQLEFEPYPVQEEALLAWFTSKQGVLVCAPTGTGKTLIAEAALFEALHTRQRAYYTTPLIALTDQKFEELQSAAVRWGFRADDIGLVTGNRRVNPQASILVVVAEILLNRLLHPEFDFDDVTAVVMDEFHNFNDPERGIVWEFALGLIPPHIRLLLLSATVGNAFEFTQWMRHQNQHDLELVQGDQRKIPLTYHWVGDQLLAEQIEIMAAGEEAVRRTPALVFCFNREQCWNVAELLKGKRVMAAGQQQQLAKELENYDWSQGAGPKLKQILMRGVGVHHAGLLPKYRRIVEDLFQRKLLSVTVCTETLAAGVNLPARSVVLPELLKGPPDKKRLIEASAAHQMFGRAGRPQFDKEGFVYALAHEDDVKLLRWREKYDQIPEDTKDPQLRKAKKQLKKKMPKRRTTEQYWTESQFEKLCAAPASKLQSRGPLPWRLLAYLLEASPEVDLIRKLVAKRLMPPKALERNQKMLDDMLKVLWKAGYVTLEPEPPKVDQQQAEAEFADASRTGQPPPTYQAQFAYPTPDLAKFALLRSVNPLFGIFLINQLGIADPEERLEAFESVLEMPGSVARSVRVPKHDQRPPGALATTRLDAQLLQLGLVTAEQLGAADDDEQEDRHRMMFPEDHVWVLTLAEKLKILFDYDFPGVHDVNVTPVWCAGEILEFGGDFNKFVTSGGLQKQEGVLFRHLLRLILLLAEFREFCPIEVDPFEWQDELDDITNRLTETCRHVDPTSTDKTLEQAKLLSEDELSLGRST